MSHATIPIGTNLAAALGRLPSGLFILTVRRPECDTGLLVSWVQQAGFHPPMITMALKQERFLARLLLETGRFTLNQVPVGHKPLIRHFAKGFDPDVPAFEGLDLVPSVSTAGPVLAEAMAFLDAEVVSHLDSGDHRVFLARVLNGAVFHNDADPMIHVRRDGFHY